MKSFILAWLYNQPDISRRILFITYIWGLFVDLPFRSFIFDWMYYQNFFFLIISWIDSWWWRTFTIFIYYCFTWLEWQRIWFYLEKKWLTLLRGIVGFDKGLWRKFNVQTFLPNNPRQRRIIVGIPIEERKIESKNLFIRNNRDFSREVCCFLLATKNPVALFYKYPLSYELN